MDDYIIEKIYFKELEQETKKELIERILFLNELCLKYHNKLLELELLTISRK